MPVKWTAERDQRLLLLIIEAVKPNCEQLALAYVNRFGTVDDARPTAKAVSEHIASLKRNSKAAGTGGTASPATPRKTATQHKTATPRKPNAPKTPNSSNKRKAKTMSGEDESEDGADANSMNVTAPRAMSARASKVQKTYAESSSESDADDEGGAETKTLTEDVPCDTHMNGDQDDAADMTLKDLEPASDGSTFEFS